MKLNLILNCLPYLVKGAVMTIELTIIAICFGLIIGLIIALAKISNKSILSKPASFYTWVIRGTPLLLQLYFLYYGLPQVGITLSSFVAASLGLSMCAGAYIAEIIRAGIESIDKGQMEAARSLGMTYFQAMRRIIIPQAYRRMIPPLGNEFIALLKDSSLVSTIAMVDLMRTANQMYATTFRPLEIFITAAVLYLMMTSFFTVGFDKIEKRLAVYET